jgi:hypothetical protein
LHLHHVLFLLILTALFTHGRVRVLIQFLELRGAWHPAVAASQSRGGASTFIPNDIVLGCEENEARFVLVTGPNMGGACARSRPPPPPPLPRT